MTELGDCSFIVLKKNDPFYEDPLPKGFYHPSSPLRISKQIQKTKLTPGRNESQRVEPAPVKSIKYRVNNQDNDEDKNYTLHYIDEQSMNGAAGGDDSGGSSKFDETWPSSTNIASSVSPVSNTITNENTSNTEKGDKDDDNESTLLRYIQRFRKGPPSSREERLKSRNTRQTDFWWLPHSSRHSESSKPELNNGQASKSESIKSTADSFQLRDMEMLQRQAELLLEKSESVLSTSDANVSSEGLGSSTTVTFDEPCYRPKFATLDEPQSKIQQHTIRSKLKTAHLTPSVDLKPSLQRYIPPEHDILYQWRLARKIESARQDQAPLMAVNKFFSDIPKKYLSNELSDKESKLKEFRCKLVTAALPVPNFELSNHPEKHPLLTSGSKVTHHTPAERPLDTDSTIADNSTSTNSPNPVEYKTKDKLTTNTHEAECVSVSDDDTIIWSSPSPINPSKNYSTQQIRKEDITSETAQMSDPSLRKPLKSKSPLKSTINQVISQCLFQSANDSNDSLNTTLPDTSIHGPVEEPRLLTSDPETSPEPNSSSSDVEYADDELLQLLRHRRQQYEDQLKHIDDLLAAHHTNTFCPEAS